MHWYVNEGAYVKLEQTSRGFSIIRFEDRLNNECSLQKSSLADEDCIWLGVDEYRMHLTRDMVAVLIPFLYNFVELGELTRES